ncbi:molybdopterin-dependent oxidoreductase [Novosphingobium sp.]|uniref:molybdopterin-dependent oxidoreductase n=1 Tax=Novosphingobium sp. TaxID=1874826 RepID=UPI00333EAEDC
MTGSVTRRGLLAGSGSLLLAGCDKWTTAPQTLDVLSLGEKASRSAQRLLVADRQALAPEFTRADLSPVFRVNGSARADSADYVRHAASHFADWTLTFDGLVNQPLALSMAQLRAAPARSQITRHDCVEGWSAIGEWHGVPLGLLLRRAGLSTRARYVVFHCADTLLGKPYYESIDLVDAFHPQTILAYSLNRAPLSIGHGAPLRLRVERQLGYKQAKYVMRVQAVDTLAGLHGGKGGFWEDNHNYQWYAGI